MTLDTFYVNGMPDGGEFARGDAAALAWDILRCTGSHRIPDTIDLSRCTHLKPYSLACLCGLAELGRYNDRQITILPPTNTPCASHFARLGLPDFFACDWGSEQMRETNFRIEHVRWPLGDTSDRIMDLLAPRASLQPGMFPRMTESLDEVMRNALTHAVSPIDCIVVGQAYPATEKVDVAVLDLGQTIRSHLTQNPRYAHLSSDTEAIRTATEDGVTGTPDGEKNHRGEDNSGAGLAELREFCESGCGELTVLSGSTWITFGPDGESEGHLHQRFQGCLVNIRYYTGNRLPEEQVDPIL